jgi:hypothetical protein
MEGGKDPKKSGQQAVFGLGSSNGCPDAGLSEL